jgi:alpha-L-rhamnosidase
MKIRKLLIYSGMISILIFSCTKKEFRVISTFCENKPDPAGVTLDHPKFSWKMVSGEREVLQTACRIIVREKASGDKIIWDSGKMHNNGSLLIPYNGPSLQAGTLYTWRVRVWDNHGHSSAWSKPAAFITGLFTPGDWGSSRWIAYDSLDSYRRIFPGVAVWEAPREWRTKSTGEHILPVLRKEFRVKPGIKQALLFVSGLGQYELNLNGIKVGDHFLSPGWTEYNQQCLYNVFNITEEVKTGANAFGVFLGNGFYIIPNTRYRKMIIAYGNPAMILKLKLLYKDGSSDEVVSDGTWRAAPGPITYSSIYAGETCNANLEQSGFDQPGFDDSSWNKVLVVKAPSEKLLPEIDYPVKVAEKISVKTVTRNDSSGRRFLYDFGQNASGIIEIAVKGNKGDTIRFYPAELIDSTRRVVQDATGKPYFFTYVLRGDSTEKWKPRFSYYGFRYVEVEGARPDSVKSSFHLPVVSAITFLHTRNSLPASGTFKTSEELFNRIYRLINWAVKSNLQSVVTDCPHREKLGWLEQTYLMGGSIHYNFDVYSLYKKIVSDIAGAQWENGMVPSIAPEYVRFSGGFVDSPEWGSAAIILPWLIYKWYGDATPMKESWHMMSRYIDYLTSRAQDLILDYGLGDWFDMGPGRPGYAQLTPVKLTATAIWYYDVKLMAEMAALTGSKSEADGYYLLADKIKTAFNKTFYNPDTHIYATGSQTAIAMPLVVGLVEEENREVVIKTLIESVHKSGNALTAGDIGFHYLVKALVEGGAGDLLYEMNTREDVPGYGFQLKKGATSLTESWNAYENVSNNHLMLGHLMEWFYAGLAGIDQTPESVAFREVKIAPQMVGNIKEASATFESPYGEISSKWTRKNKEAELEIVIPVNTTARVYIPAAPGTRLLESGIPVPAAWISGNEKETLILKVGSGSYHFSFPLNR